MKNSALGALALAAVGMGVFLIHPWMAKGSLEIALKSNVELGVLSFNLDHSKMEQSFFSSRGEGALSVTQNNCESMNSQAVKLPMGWVRYQVSHLPFGNNVEFEWMPSQEATPDRITHGMARLGKSGLSELRLELPGFEQPRLKTQASTLQATFSGDEIGIDLDLPLLEVSSATSLSKLQMHEVSLRYEGPLPAKGESLESWFYSGWESDFKAEAGRISFFKPDGEAFHTGSLQVSSQSKGDGRTLDSTSNLQLNLGVFSEISGSIDAQTHSELPLDSFHHLNEYLQKQACSPKQEPSDSKLPESAPPAVQQNSNETSSAVTQRGLMQEQQAEKALMQSLGAMLNQGTRFELEKFRYDGRFMGIPVRFNLKSKFSMRAQGAKPQERLNLLKTVRFDSELDVKSDLIDQATFEQLANTRLLSELPHKPGRLSLQFHLGPDDVLLNGQSLLDNSDPEAQQRIDFLASMEDALNQVYSQIQQSESRQDP